MKLLDKALVALAALWQRFRKRIRRRNVVAKGDQRARVRHAGDTGAAPANRHQRRALRAAMRGKGGWGWRQLAMRKGERRARARARALAEGAL